MQNIKFPIKLKVTKSKEMIYFSQLDLALTLRRALRRTGLANYFSQGFRPRIKISFQGALRLGEESEIVATFYFQEKVSKEKVKSCLDAELPSGLGVELTD